MSDASRIWGNAYYHNGERKNVQWNESADYELIYPYVMADTIGGDIKSETYFFEGGYAASHGRWTFGGEFSYRALLEYRDVDPRPRNSIADLQGKAGASYQFNKRYAVALSAEALSTNKMGISHIIMNWEYRKRSISPAWEQAIRVSTVPAIR